MKIPITKVTSCKSISLTCLALIHFGLQRQISMHSTKTVQTEDGLNQLWFTKLPKDWLDPYTQVPHACETSVCFELHVVVNYRVCFLIKSHVFNFLKANHNQTFPKSQVLSPRQTNFMQNRHKLVYWMSSDWLDILLTLLFLLFFLLTLNIQDRQIIGMTDRKYICIGLGTDRKIFFRKSLHNVQIFIINHQHCHVSFLAMFCGRYYGGCESQYLPKIVLIWL